MLNLEKPKVLLVDDDPDLLVLLSEVCEGLGCDVQKAQNGRVALEFLKVAKFTVVISDMRMPQMDGMSLLRSIEKMGFQVPVIMMTGHSDFTPEDVDAANGVVLLAKPFSRQQLKETVEEFIKLLPAV